MARHLPEVKSKVSLIGVSLTDIPLQGASTSSKHAVRERQGLLVPQTGELRLLKEALSGSARRKLRKSRIGDSEAITGGSQQPGNASRPNLGETSIETAKRPRSEGSTPTGVAIEPKRSRDLRGPGNYTGALTNTKMAIFKELYPEDKLNEDDQKFIVMYLKKCCVGILQKNYLTLSHID
jgi:hypothetical protein